MFYLCYVILIAMGGNTTRVARSSGHVAVEDDVELYYRTVGKGDETVVVLHGGPGFSLEYLLPDLRPLARGRRLLLYDQRSSGRSTLLEDSERNTLDDMVADLESVRQHFDLEELVVLGHSWGGYLAGRYAVEYPGNVARLVLVGASGPAPGTYRGEYEPADRIRPEHRRVLDHHRAAFADDPASMRNCWNFWAITAEGYHSTPKHVGQMWGDLCDRPPEKIRSPQPTEGIGYPEGVPDIRDGLADVTAPVLVVHAEDGAIPMSAANAWVDGFPNARLFSMPTGGHVPWVERPYVFFPAVDSFLRGSWPVPPEPDGTWTPPADDDDRSLDSGTYEALFEAIETAGDAYADALNDGEWERAAACFTEDGMLLGPSAPPAKGRQAIAAFWEVAHERGFREVDLQPIEVEGVDDRAFELGKYVVRGGAEVLLDHGKYMVHWRQIGEDWLLYRDIYNSSRATQSPLEVPHYLPPPEGTFSGE